MLCKFMNRLDLQGNRQQITKLINTVVNNYTHWEDDRGGLVFEFSKIIPPPESLDDEVGTDGIQALCDYCSLVASIGSNIIENATVFHGEAIISNLNIERGVNMIQTPAMQTGKKLFDNILNYNTIYLSTWKYCNWGSREEAIHLTTEADTIKFISYGGTPRR